MALISKQGAVRIVEVGPRDGLQNVSKFVPTSIKVELIDRLRKAGHTTIEITSLVSPKAVPQMSDCRQILSNPTVKAMLADQGLRAPVLVANSKGLDIAAQSGVREIAVFVSASEGFSRANINCNMEEGLRRASTVAQQAKRLGMAVRG